MKKPVYIFNGIVGMDLLPSIIQAKIGSEILNGYFGKGRTMDRLYFKHADTLELFHNEKARIKIIFR